MPIDRSTDTLDGNGVELKPCPFCGGAATHVETSRIVSCSVCDGGFYGDTDAHAIAAWNCRAPIAPSQTAVEPVAELVERLRVDAGFVRVRGRSASALEIVAKDIDAAASALTEQAAAREAAEKRVSELTAQNVALDSDGIAARKSAAANLARAEAAEARALTAHDDAIRKAAEAGWNACRKSIYAVCEDVQRQADDTRIKASVGTASEEQYSKGYHVGTHYAAKSIARGFNSMEARDDDNLSSAIVALLSDAPKTEAGE